VIYNVGDEERKFFFLQNGFVKIGTITDGGREVIYDLKQFSIGGRINLVKAGGGWSLRSRGANLFSVRRGPEPP
jgi:hypothetical protein